MIRFTRHKQVVAVALIGAALVPAAPASADTSNILDLSAGAGLSTNPGINGNGNGNGNGIGSGFGRISAYGNHSWKTERSETSIHGFLENTFYFKGGYGSRRIFNVGARHELHRRVLRCPCTAISTSSVISTDSFRTG